MSCFESTTTHNPHLSDFCSPRSNMPNSKEKRKLSKNCVVSVSLIALEDKRMPLPRTAYPKMYDKLCGMVEMLTADAAADEQLALVPKMN